MEPEQEKVGTKPGEERRQETCEELMGRYKSASIQEARGILYAIAECAAQPPLLDIVAGFLIKVGDEVERHEGYADLRKQACILLVRKVIPLLIEDCKRSAIALNITESVFCFLTRHSAHTQCSGRDIGFLQSFFSVCLDLYEQNHTTAKMGSGQLAKAFIAIGLMEPVMTSPSLRYAAVPLLYRHFRYRLSFIEEEESEWLKTGRGNLTTAEEMERIKRDIIRVNVVCGFFFAEVDPQDTRGTTENMRRDHERASALLKITAHQASRMFVAVRT